MINHHLQTLPGNTFKLNIFVFSEEKKEEKKVIVTYNAPLIVLYVILLLKNTNLNLADRILTLSST